MMADKKLEVSVVVIAYNEEANIKECLDSLMALDYPSDRHEVIVVDNASSDRTAAVVREMIAGKGHMRLVSNPVPGIAPSRNCGLKESKYPFVAFIDADCTAEKDWLSALVSAMTEERARDPKIVAVGGPNISPEKTTEFRKAVAVAVATFWGNHGSVQGMVLGDRTYVDHLPTLNVLYDRELVLAEGGFDTGMGNISEDVDLSYRLGWRGYKLLYEPKAVVRHRWREDAWSWMKNMAIYGKGRSWLMKKDRRFIRPLVLVPIGLVLVTAISIFPQSFPLGVLPALYFAMTLAASIHACLRARRPALVPMVFFIYIMTHYSYGFGQLQGLVTRRGSGVR